MCKLPAFRLKARFNPPSVNMSGKSANTPSPCHIREGCIFLASLKLNLQTGEPWSDTLSVRLLAHKDKNTFEIQLPSRHVTGCLSGHSTHHLVR